MCCGKCPLAMLAERVRREKLRHDTGDARYGMAPDKIDERLLGVISVQEFSELEVNGRAGWICAWRGHLDTADGIAPHYRKEIQRRGTDVGSQLLLQDRKQKAFRQIHSEQRVQLRPDIGFRSYRHEQADELSGIYIRVVGP